MIHLFSFRGFADLLGRCLNCCCKVLHGCEGAPLCLLSNLLEGHRPLRALRICPGAFHLGCPDTHITQQVLAAHSDAALYLHTKCVHCDSSIGIYLTLKSMTQCQEDLGNTVSQHCMIYSLLFGVSQLAMCDCKHTEHSPLWEITKV